MPPLRLRPLLLIVVRVASLTLRISTIEEFTHGYRLKIIVRQLTISFATTTSCPGSLDGFYFLIGVALCGGIFAAWQKPID